MPDVVLYETHAQREDERVLFLDLLVELAVDLCCYPAAASRNRLRHLTDTKNANTYGDSGIRTIRAVTLANPDTNMSASHWLERLIHLVERLFDFFFGKSSAVRCRTFLLALSLSRSAVNTTAVVKALAVLSRHQRA